MWFTFQLCDPLESVAVEGITLATRVIRSYFIISCLCSNCVHYINMSVSIFPHLLFCSSDLVTCSFTMTVLLQLLYSHVLKHFDVCPSSHVSSYPLPPHSSSSSSFFFLFFFFLLLYFISSFMFAASLKLVSIQKQLAFLKFSWAVIGLCREC